MCWATNGGQKLIEFLFVEKVSHEKIFFLLFKELIVFDDEILDFEFTRGGLMVDFENFGGDDLSFVFFQIWEACFHKFLKIFFVGLKMLFHEGVSKACFAGWSFGLNRASFGNEIICFYLIVLGVLEEIVLMEDRGWESIHLFISVFVEIEVSDHTILWKHWWYFMYLSNKYYIFNVF